MSEQKLTRRQQVEQYLKEPNVRRYLDMLAFAEGTEKHGYYTKFGGGKIDDLSWHPNVFWGATGDGKTSATGRYQILKGTWAEQAKKLDLKDFGPESQDMAAVSLIMQRGAINDILNGDIDTANRKLSKEWASLPYNNSPHQHQKTTEQVLQKWEQLGGKEYYVPVQQYDYSTTKPLNTALQNFPEIQPLEEPEYEEQSDFPQVQQVDLNQSFNVLNNTNNAFAPQEENTLTAFQEPEPELEKPNYDEQLAKAFGVVPSTKGKIPQHIDDMIKSIYDQTA